MDELFGMAVSRGEVDVDDVNVGETEMGKPGLQWPRTAGAGIKEWNV